MALKRTSKTFFILVLGLITLSIPSQIEAAVCRYTERVYIGVAGTPTRDEARCQPLQVGDTTAQSNECSNLCAPAGNGLPGTCVVDQTACDSAPSGVQDDKLKAYVISLQNPLGSKYQKDAGVLIPELLGTLISNALGLVGTLTLVVFIYGGFVWLTSAGNEEKVSKGTHAMMYAAIGICIIFSSYAILQLVFQAFR